MLLRNRFALPIALATALLLPAVPAAADDDDDDRRGWRGHRGHHRSHGDHDRHRSRHHGGHHRHHRGCGHGGHGGHGGYYAPRYVVKNHYHGYPVHYYDRGPESYYCGPCSDHFDSYDDLSYHVHRRHHVAVLQLPFVIFQASIGGGVGWVFGH
jgi:hypothetical protein